MCKLLHIMYHLNIQSASSNGKYVRRTLCRQRFALTHAPRDSVARSWARSHDYLFPCRRCFAHAPTSCPSGTQSWARSHFAIICKQACIVGSMLTKPARKKTATSATFCRRHDSLCTNTFIFVSTIKGLF